MREASSQDITNITQSLQPCMDWTRCGFLTSKKSDEWPNLKISTDNQDYNIYFHR